MFRDEIGSPPGKKLMRIKGHCFMCKKLSLRKNSIASDVEDNDLFSLTATKFIFEINNPTKQRMGTLGRLCIPHSF